MRQLVQSIRNGELQLLDCPTPEVGPTEVLVQTAFSALSPGTESALRNLASSSLLSKARARPDLVKQVLRKARSQGISSTLNSVNSRLDDNMPLGYSASGTVIKIGEAVQGLRVGMRVATGSAGHADMQVVPGNLCVPVPDSVSLEDASFATVSSIALHGLRLSEVQVGGAICIVGLGLLGQIAARLASASGIRVFGVDVRQSQVQRLIESGMDAEVENGNATTSRIMEWSRHRGVDAVLITAATSSSEPARLASHRLRDRGSIIVVGDVGLSLERTPLYYGEQTVKVARSYGPGRYERSFEEWGVDLPNGYVPFSERRNLETVLDLMATNRFRVDDLVTHSFDFSEAIGAYQVLSEKDDHLLGIRLDYKTALQTAVKPTTEAQRPHASAVKKGELTIALIGAGNFAKGVLIPVIKDTNFGRIAFVSSSTGLSAAHLAPKIGAVAVSSEEAITIPDVDLVAIASSHSSHASLIIKALESGKHVYCEKPPVISRDELDRVQKTLSNSTKRLIVGFNRRFSPDLLSAKEYLSQYSGPTNIIYRVNAGTLPVDHWFGDRLEGGRLIGECCHFVDACNFAVGGVPQSVRASSSVKEEAMLANDIAAVLGYADGSLATILYTSQGSAKLDKEYIEIHRSGHSVVIHDFSGTSIDGRTKRHKQDKGFRSQFQSARELLNSATPLDSSYLSSMETTFRIADNLVA